MNEAAAALTEPLCERTAVVGAVTTALMYEVPLLAISPRLFGALKIKPLVELLPLLWSVSIALEDTATEVELVLAAGASATFVLAVTTKLSALVAAACASGTLELTPSVMASELAPELWAKAILVKVVRVALVELTEEGVASGTPVGTVAVIDVDDVLAAPLAMIVVAVFTFAAFVDVELAPARATEVAAVTLAALVELPAAPASGTPLLTVGARLSAEAAADAARLTLAGSEINMLSALLPNGDSVKRAGAVRFAPVALVEAAPVNGTLVPVVATSESLLVPAAPASDKVVCAVTRMPLAEVAALLCSGTPVGAVMLRLSELVAPDACS